MKTIFRVLLMAFSFSLFAQSPVAPIADGERIVFFGDSITHGGRYIYYLQLFQELRHPGSNARLLNAGVSGDSAGGALSRWAWDPKPMNGDRYFVMFGMNDVGRDAYSTTDPTEKDAKRRQDCFDSHVRNMRKLTGLIQEMGRPVVLMTTTPYDQYSDQPGENLVSCNEPGLANIAQAARDLAAERDFGLVEFHKPCTAILKAHPELHLCGGDRIHPKEIGHLVMASLILQSMGEKGFVAALTLDAAGKKVTRNANAYVKNLKFQDDGLSFTYEPKALPFPLLPEYLEADRLLDISAILNQEILTVKGLEAGKYILKANDVTLGTFSADDFAQGINLALLDTPSQKIAQEAGKVMYKLQGKDSTLRQLPFMEMYINWEGGNVKDEQNSYDTLDKWVEKLVREKNRYLDYFRSCAEDYKKLRPQLPKLQAEVEDVRRELAAFRPAPFEIELTRTAK